MAALETPKQRRSREKKIREEIQILTGSITEKEWGMPDFNEEDIISNQEFESLINNIENVRS